jgi:hypothetical protein
MKLVLAKSGAASEAVGALAVVVAVADAAAMAADGGNPAGSSHSTAKSRRGPELNPGPFRSYKATGPSIRESGNLLLIPVNFLFPAISQSSRGLQ